MRDQEHRGELPTSSVSNRTGIGYRWWLIGLLFVAGTALCVAAFVTDARGWGGLGPSALLQFGSSIGLVGVLFLIEKHLVREVVYQLRDAVTVNAYVRKLGEDAWDTWTVVRPGTQLEYLIRFENSSDRTLMNVMVGNNLPKYVSYVEGSTQLRNGANPSGLVIENDNITRGGINVGEYEPGAVGYVWFAARVDPINVFEKVGAYDVRNVGVVRPAGLNEHYNVAKVLIDVPG